MLSQVDGHGYNERLFSGRLRRYLHLARFRWVATTVARLRCNTARVLELGCFDAKTLDFLRPAPNRYVGLDANWEGGLDIARARWTHAGYTFHLAQQPEDLQRLGAERFSLALAMETLEHLPPEQIGAYLQNIAERLDGYLLVTVPNEKGPVFLAKWLAKRLFSRDAQSHSVAELLYATTGQCHRVARDGHKGFDYSALADEISRYFDVLSIEGHPLRLPTPISFGVGIVARSRRQS
jgi:2-polyprenyl-3-methyl-5-hydroxy-6-metoxy-1,4-benzoquinol methylase